jgi:hypothetical protein
MARRVASWRIAALAGAMAIVCNACSDTPLPGRLLGTYKVVGEAQSNTCGLGAPNPWTFDVQLSEKGTLLYWSWLDGKAPLSAPIDALSTTLTASEQANVDGTADGRDGPCTMERSDRIPLALAAGWPPPTFTGTIVFAFSASPGADCSDQLTARGGLYATLPCGITYTVSGSRVSGP